MGNCMEVYLRPHNEEKTHHEEEKQKPISGFVSEGGFEKSGFRVKIVLPKEELEWLMLQLGDKKGGKRLKDVLREIEKEREKVEEEEKDVKVWKPSLESIMESPEIHEMDR
ncbi:hypothetical protein BVC80_9007g8 [Macleaya cordata]|uniref:Uncharacterized protein n=1 Tax=Macleaya cordata TaxID=56857 RepID=A0A200QLD0_MACCD|nr:hypothetical protein BVC80_9007g8 [Macleaya cordata]